MVNALKCKSAVLVTVKAIRTINLTIKENGEYHSSGRRKDLGVIRESKLTFDKHVAACVKKTNGVLASIRRTISYEWHIPNDA